MEKLDFLVTHKAEYAAPKKPALVEIGPASYLAIEGVGKPGGALFEAHIGAVYGMAFTVKMSRKAAGLGDYAICKLECRILSERDYRELHWQILMRTPDFVSEADLVPARKKLLAKGDNDEVEKVKLVQLTEGQCVQYLHVGPYQNEGASYDLMTAFAAGKGLKPAGAPHEIYISDPRRVEPEKLKTILRLPVAPA